MARVGMRDVLGRHFQEATRCLPGPLGDDAVEWDYSRVSRALGLAGTPTLDELPHSGAAVLGLPVGEWAATAEMYREWAQEAGWSFVHTSATPTVAVPDPVIYALGLGVAGPDSLIFGRALNRRCAFLGPRPRSEGMSIALTPGERWLIGADRVRRRCGQEAAGNGLLVVVEDAEHITPSAAAVLGYSIEAHRAWKGRMLSRDAKVYVVFVSTPEHEQRLLDLLEENDLRGDIRTVNGSAPSPPFATYGTDFVGVEEEHILGALRDAPFALSSMDVQAIFGRAGLETCRGLAERGYLAARVQNGLEYWVEAPRGRQIGRFDAPAARVRRAVLDRYALLARQGREWLRPGAALLAFRLGRRSLALGFVGRTGHAECALVPAALFGELDGHLEASREELRCYHFAAWFGMAAHRRRYAHAGALARDLTRIPLRTELDLTRTVIHILCAGRTHLDHALPSNFWTSLHSDTLDPSLLDATAILSDVFVRLRHMGFQALGERLEVAREIVKHLPSRQEMCQTRQRHPRPKEIVDILLARAELIATGIRNEKPPQSLSVAHVRPGRLGILAPAYMAATLMTSQRYSVLWADDGAVRTSAQSIAWMLLQATGNPSDLNMQQTINMQWLVRRQLRLLTRECADEVLLQAQRGHPFVKHDAGWTLQLLAGRRLFRIGSSILMLRSRKFLNGDIEPTPVERVIVASQLLDARRPGSAQEWLEQATSALPFSSSATCVVVHAHAEFAMRTLSWRHLDVAEELRRRYEESLEPPHDVFIRFYLDGTRALVRSEFASACRMFALARQSMVKTIAGSFGWLRGNALQQELLARRLADLKQSLQLSERQGVRTPTWQVVLGELGGRLRCHSSSEGPLRDRLAKCASHVALACELLARRGSYSSDEDLIECASALVDVLRPVQDGCHRDVARSLEACCPTFVTALRSAVSAVLHDGTEIAGSSVQASFLSILEDLSCGRGHVRLGAAGLVDRPTPIPSSGRLGRDDARVLSSGWDEDAAVLDRCLAHVVATPEGVSPPNLNITTYGYFSKTSKSYSASKVTVELRRQHATAPLEVRMRWRHDESLEEGGKSAGDHRAARSRRSGSRVPRALLGDSKAATILRQSVAAASSCEHPVLITGPTGSGKEHVARLLHAQSARKRGELVVASCGSIAESLLESELFGHVRGAFTGAVKDHQGLFARAHGSSLLLDEIDSMSPRMQVLLLRVLETGEYRPVGVTQAHWSDFRLISAGLPCFDAMVNEGGFREDLYYRMSTMRIEVPALKDRGDDCIQFARAHVEAAGKALAASACEEIRCYDWPGNIRQLHHCLDVAALHANGGTIDRDAVRVALDTYARRSVTRAGETSRARWGEAACLRAIDHFAHGKLFGVGEFAEAAGVSRRSAQRHLAALVRSERIVRQGAGRSTQYRIPAR